jgi:hypothetical protein
MIFPLFNEIIYRSLSPPKSKGIQRWNRLFRRKEWLLPSAIIIFFYKLHFANDKNQNSGINGYGQ